MNDDPEADDAPHSEADDTSAVEQDAPETKHIEDDGEPLGANLA